VQLIPIVLPGVPLNLSSDKNIEQISTAVTRPKIYVQCILNVMAHAQKTEFVFRRNGRVHLNRRGLQFSRLLAAEVCASVLVMLDAPRSDVV